mmetsp:Transcript_4003/g.12791  ORF Transcript_4003/g.12791 Transcript_4003/m.12791 type:complete len:221 (+) Transcript_4003:1166-1828(+)
MLSTPLFGRCRPRRSAPPRWRRKRRRRQRSVRKRCGCKRRRRRQNSLRVLKRRKTERRRQSGRPRRRRMQRRQHARPPRPPRKPLRRSERRAARTRLARALVISRIAPSCAAVGKAAMRRQAAWLPLLASIPAILSPWWRLSRRTNNGSRVNSVNFAHSDPRCDSARMSWTSATLRRPKQQQQRWPRQHAWLSAKLRCDGAPSRSQASQPGSRHGKRRCG